MQNEQSSIIQETEEEKLVVEEVEEKPKFNLFKN